MIKEEFKIVYEKYNPIFVPMISKMIQDNYKYFQISETIKWGFGYDNDLAIMGTCDRNNNEIHLNIFSVKKAYEDNGNVLGIVYDKEDKKLDSQFERLNYNEKLDVFSEIIIRYDNETYFEKKIKIISFNSKANGFDLAHLIQEQKVQ